MIKYTLAVEGRDEDDVLIWGLAEGRDGEEPEVFARFKGLPIEAREWATNGVHDIEFDDWQSGDGTAHAHYWTATIAEPHDDPYYDDY